MKKISMKKILLPIIILVIVLVGIGICYYSGIIPKFGGRSTVVGQVTVRDITKTEKLKVLTMYKEVRVYQRKTNSSLLSLFTNTDVQICAVYPARLDFGFDLSKCDADWIQEDGDTIIVTLPPVEILNKDQESIDETNMRVPIESGNWSSEEMEDFRNRAEAIMLRSCERDNCYELAEQQAEMVVARLFEALGAHHVKVEIQERERYGLGQLIQGYKDDNPYIFYKDEGVNELQYKDGAILFYNNLDELTYEQLLAFADFYKVMAPDLPLANLFVEDGIVHFQVHDFGLQKNTPETTKVIAELNEDEDMRLCWEQLQNIADNMPLYYDILDKNGELLTSITPK